MSKGDQAFRAKGNNERWPEMTYGGALSFLRRRYSRDLEGVDVVVSGVPYDAAVSYRSGCRLGPRAIREASVQLAELKAFPFGFDPFETLSVVDWGDCMVDPHHPETVPADIEAHAAAILESGAKMLTFGGDHFVAYPLIKAHAEKYGPISLIQFDAHCDTWEDEPGRLDHGSMFARAASEGVIDVTKSTQIGLRTYNDSDHGFEILTTPWVHRNGIDAALDVIKARAGDTPVYISFDVDGLDPAFAPGTGTPVAGGLASWQALELIRGLGSLNLIGMDVVEVSPPYDHAEITALAAATVAHDWLCLMAQKNGAKGVEVGRL
ncbi:agmatinase [Rhodobacterales bacterium 52_120_T64]|nr:agmatinase [Rhodobacterales bacterium 52_120_T64]